MQKKYLCGFALIVSVSACKDEVPSRVAFDAPPSFVADDGLHPLNVKVSNKAGEVLAAPAVTFTAAPPGILEVTQSGEYRCAKSGDASIVIMAPPVTSQASVACRVARSVTAAKDLDVAVGGEPADLVAVALDSEGRPLKEAVVAQTGFDQKIVRVDGGKVLGLAAGTTTVTSTIGSLKADTVVHVREPLSSEPLSIPDGTAVMKVFEEGNYLVEVNAPAGPRTGVTLAWIGAPCPAQPERQAHSVKCHVKGTATLKIENPALLGMGTAAAGFIKVTRLP